MWGIKMEIQKRREVLFFLSISHLKEITLTFFPEGPGLPMFPLAPTGPEEPWMKLWDTYVGPVAILRKPIRLVLLFFMSFPAAPWCLLNKRPSPPSRERQSAAKQVTQGMLLCRGPQVFLCGDTAGPYGALVKNRKGALDMTNVSSKCSRLVVMYWLCEDEILSFACTVPCTHPKKNVFQSQSANGRKCLPQTC